MRWISRFNVTGSQGDPYVVSIADTGQWGCSCPAWKFARAQHAGVKPACKHIHSVRDGVSLELGKRRAAVAKQDTLVVSFGSTPIARVPGPNRRAERDRIAAEIGATPAAPGPGGRFAGLDYSEAEVRALATEGARFRFLDYDIESKAA